MINNEIKKALVKATKSFWEKGLTPGSDDGDLSIKDPENNNIYICPRPNQTLKIPNWGVITDKDVVVMDIEGKIIENTDVLPTVEYPMHLAIYKARPGVNAIVHSHAVWSSAFAITGKNIPLVLSEQSLHLGGEIVCAEYGKVGSKVLAQNVVKALGKEKMAALLRNHGAVVLGKDIKEALMLSDFLEIGAKAVILGSILGKVIEIKPEDILDESLQ
jgi:L-ribulose-5-phosphate 4-epimerase